MLPSMKVAGARRGFCTLLVRVMIQDGVRDPAGVEQWLESKLDRADFAALGGKTMECLKDGVKKSMDQGNSALQEGLSSGVASIFADTTKKSIADLLRTGVTELQSRFLVTVMRLSGVNDEDSARKWLER
jgi:hypothetical protein